MNDILINNLWKAKFKAFGIHLIVSIVLISCFMFVTTEVWYPGVLFSLENVWQGLQILLPVDAILGPLLTLILFVPGKKGLVGDLIIVATMQLLALLAGGYIIYSQRPEIMVFTADRFEIIPSSKFDRESFADKYFEDSTDDYPLVVYALPAQTPEEKNNFVLNSVQYQQMSERYRPLKNYKDILINKTLAPSSLLPEDEASAKVLAAFNKKHKDRDLLLLPLEATTGSSAIIILDKNTLQNLGYLNFDPWKNYKTQSQLEAQETQP
jgi:hypothetical protein